LLNEKKYISEEFNVNENNPYSFFPSNTFKVRGLLEGLVNVIITDEKKRLVNMRELHEVLKVNTRFNDWIARRIEYAGFETEKDYYFFLSKSTGGRPKTEYYFLLDAAKETAMMENNDMGRMFRKYFIDMEQAVSRFLGKQTRYTLTDVIRDYWKPNDNNFYGRVTNELVYKPLFNRDKNGLLYHYKIKGNLRDGLGKEELELIDEQESKIIEFIVEYGQSFDEIKSMMHKKRIKTFFKSHYHIH
jgi:phage anti-repressor protein